MRSLPALTWLVVILTIATPLPAAAVMPDPKLAVEGLLSDRVRAIEVRDRDAFSKTIDPQASNSFREAEMKRFDGAVTVPLVDFDFTIDTTDSGDLAAGLDLAAQYEAEVAYLPTTKRTYRIKDFDSVPAQDEFWYTYVQRDGQWYVASDSDLTAIGLQNTPAIWDYGPVKTQQTDHFIVLAGVDNAERASEIARLAEDAFVNLAERWQISWSERVPIVLPDTAEQAAQLLRTPTNVANFVAFVSYTPLRGESSYLITPPRVFIQDDNLIQQSRERQIADLTHELTHAAAAQQSGPFTPPWLQEGLAEYVRLNRPNSFPIPEGTAALPGSDQFTASGTSLQNAYRSSTSAVAYSAFLRGPDAPSRLFLALGKRRITPGTATYNVDQAMQEALGVGLMSFEAGWLGRTS